MAQNKKEERATFVVQLNLAKLKIKKTFMSLASSKPERHDMSFPEKTVLAVDTNIGPDILKPIHRLDFLSRSEIHFIHIVQKFEYGDGLSFNVTFPFDEDMDIFRESIIKKMKEMTKEILPVWHQGHVVYECRFAFDPKEDFCKYLEEVNADLAIIATRARRGIFESSFASRVTSHSKCSVLVLKSGGPYV